MKRSARPWPVLIDRLARAFIRVAHDHGIDRGGVRVYETTENGETVYVIAVRVPAGETAMSRHMAPPKTK